MRTARTWLDQAEGPAHHAAGRVRVGPAQVLGGRTQDQVHAVLQRPAANGRVRRPSRPPAAHHGSMRDLGQGGQVGHGGVGFGLPCRRTRPGPPVSVLLCHGRDRSRPRKRSAPQLGPRRGAGTRTCPGTPRPGVTTGAVPAPAKVQNTGPPRRSRTRRPGRRLAKKTGENQANRGAFSRGHRGGDAFRLRGVVILSAVARRPAFHQRGVLGAGGVR